MAKGIVLVAHCILNPRTVVRGRSIDETLARGAVEKLLGRGFAIVQLPCPEFLYLGPDRWAQSLEQYDTLPFRRHCGRLLEPVLEQVLMHDGAGSPVAAVLGVDGSPTCGVNQTTSAPYGGCFTTETGGPAPLPEARKVNRPGVFLRRLKELLAACERDVLYLGLPRVSAEKEAKKTFLDALETLDE